MNGPTQSAINEQLDPLDDIETMLVNLSNELDMMLVNDKNWICLEIVGAINRYEL
mgnify:CR=1 FL=1